MSECTICRDPFGSRPRATELETQQKSHIDSNDGTFKVATTKCGHLFHYKCILDWVTLKGSQCKCPICNKKVTRSTLIVIYHDWNLPPEQETTSYLDSIEAQRLLSKSQDLQGKLMKASSELYRAQKDLRDLRRHLKSQLQEEVLKNRQLTKKLHSFESHPSHLDRKRNQSTLELPSPKKMMATTSSSIIESKPSTSRENSSYLNPPLLRRYPDFNLLQSEPQFSNGLSFVDYNIDYGHPNYTNILDTERIGFSSNSNSQASGLRRINFRPEPSPLSLPSYGDLDLLHPLLRVDLSRTNASPPLPSQPEPVVDLTDSNVLDLTED